MWYQFAKTSAEEAATKFLTQNNIDYVVMNPAVSIGPLLQPDLNDTSTLLLNLINGILLFVGDGFFFNNL
jgi:nucleoside-diphosphate-sugar epimerase